jgi:T5orf172 domain
LAREEQRLLKDMEQAQDDERHYEKLLEKAKAEAASVSGQKLEAFSQQIRLLERDLAEAKAKAARAQAMAERTSSGYVYVISNVGSFGADVVKIGLTRRLDPMDRVKELGDASVPFVFDTHAIIYSDNAPALERALHGEFESVRINTQNYRKEFFRVALENVEDAVKRLAPSAPFFRDVEAQEFRETVSKRNAALGMQEDRSRYDFPVSV